MSEVRCPSAKCRATGKMPAIPAPSGSEGGGYLRHARTRHGASVRGYTRRRFRCRSMPLQWRHLRFTIQRRWSPKKDRWHDSTSLDDLSIPPRGVQRRSRVTPSGIPVRCTCAAARPARGASLWRSASEEGCPPTSTLRTLNTYQSPLPRAISTPVAQATEPHSTRRPFASCRTSVAEFPARWALHVRYALPVRRIRNL